MANTAAARGATLTELVAAEIRAQMGRRNVRQSELARTLGVTEMWLSRRLRGQQALDLNDLEAISKALECRIIDLLPDGGGEVNLRKPQTPVRPPDTRPAGRAGALPVRRPRRVTNALPAPAMMVMSGR